jgi:hypothetical protein
MKKIFTHPLQVVSLGLLIVGTVSADVKTFVIDTSQSSLTIASGELVGVTVEEQAPGSLTATYSGSIEADVTEESVTFVGGSSLAANDSGDWEPLVGGATGRAPASYGAKGGNWLASGTAALRNVVFDLTSDAITMLNGTFAADSLEFSFPDSATSTLDYNIISGILGDDAGSQTLAGRAKNDILTAASITVVGDDLVLTIPVDYTLVLTGDVSAQFRVVGQIVGTAANTTPPTGGILKLVVTPGQLSFSILTTPGKTYTILGSTDLLDFSTVIDQFIAVDSQTARDIATTLQHKQFFIVREE